MKLSEFTPELFDGIFDQMLNESKSLKRVLQERKIPFSSFLRAIEQTPELIELYSVAQQAYAEGIVNEIIEIADTDFDAQRARNRIEARKWMASKLKPKKYAESIDVNVNQTISIGNALKLAKARIQREVNEIPEAPEIPKLPKFLD